jgi:uncharacterized protein
MTSPSKQQLSAALAGALFGVGLLLSGMTQPSKVIGFLDVFGAWDASLAFVMLGAIGVHALGYRWVRRRSAPLFAKTFAVPTRRDLDAKLLIGAGLFGIGWGLSGYCPGPAVVSLASLGAGVLVFMAALALGMALTARLVAAGSGAATPSAAE